MNGSPNRNQESTLVQRFIAQCLKYQEIVVNQVLASQLLFDDDSLEIRQEIARVDENRFRIHDSLIAQLNAVNRLCSKYGVKPLYEGSEDRREKGDFALETITENFKARN
jgi:hypothetical protein